MGLFDDFDINMDDVKVNDSYSFEDGHYDFVIAEALVQNGSKSHPETTYFIIKYDLNDGESGTYWEWFTLAVDGSAEAAKAQQSLGFLKSRLMDLGFEAAELNDISPEMLEGIAGTLEIKTTNGKGKNSATLYQNLRNVKVSAPEPEPEVESDAESKQRVAAKRAARQAPVARKAAVVEDDEDENPFE